MEEINLPVSECVRVFCALMSDVLTAGWNEKVLRAIGYSVRYVSNDELIRVLRQTIKTSLVDSSRAFDLW